MRAAAGARLQTRGALGLLLALTHAATLASGCHTQGAPSGGGRRSGDLRSISDAPASPVLRAEERSTTKGLRVAQSTTAAPGVDNEADARNPESLVAGCQAREARPFPDASSPRDAQIFKQVSDRLARIRHFRPFDDVPIIRVDSRLRRTLLTGELDCLEPKAAGRAFDEALMALGLLPWGFDSRSAMLEQSSADERGLYFVSLRAIAVPQAMDDQRLWSSLVHETAHAYQDRLYRLGDELVYRPGRGDRAAAYHSLAEGEALYLELSEQLATSERQLPGPDEIEESLERASRRVALPRILTGAFVAPYGDGYRFVSYLHRLGGWPLVDAVWVRGLTRTSELLHPERWIADNTPMVLAPAPNSPAMARPQPNAGDWTRRIDEALGEQTMRVVLHLGTQDREEVRAVSTHYVDDRLTSFTRGAGGVRTVWQIRFATRAAATRAESLLAKALLPDARSSGPAIACSRAGSVAVVSLTVVERDIRVLGRADSDSSDTRTWRTRCDELRDWSTGLF